MAYEQVQTVKVKDPHKPGDYMLVNAADYRMGLPQHHYDLGLAYHPDDYPLFDQASPRRLTASEQRERDARAETVKSDTDKK
jgi:hypothetical protein